MKNAYDCIVIGGGPAGCSAAALVAEAGYSTLLVERERVPRFHVGESLMPETYWPLQRLGLVEKMQQSDFVRKESVQFVSHRGNESAPFFFREHDPRESSTTWQVERAKFDKMLFDNAAEKGADCYDETRVVKVLFDDAKATGVKVSRSGWETVDVESRVVIDATGQQAKIANQLGLKIDDPNLRKVAIWTYHKNAYRPEGDNAGATVILHTKNKDSWFWYIPLSNNITSVGVVGDTDYLIKGRGTPEETYQEELELCPNMQCRLDGSERVDDYHVAREFSYSTSQRAGEGWVLTGDAYGFIDPIYSSGVYFALQTGQLAADAVIEGLKNDRLDAEQLGGWTTGFDAGAQWIRKLVSAYYTNEFSIGGFLKQNPQHVGNLTDLLIGRIFEEDSGNIFTDMDPAMRVAKESDAGMGTSG